MKRNVVIAIIFLLVSFTVSACAPVAPIDSDTSTPEFFNDIGKTLSELKNEHPEGECCFANKLQKIFMQSAKKKRRLKGF